MFGDGLGHRSVGIVAEGEEILREAPALSRQGAEYIKSKPPITELEIRDELMSYAIDLNQRQSARTLEQAIRYQAATILEPRIWQPGEIIHCQLQACELPGAARRLYAAPLTMVTCPEEAAALPAAPPIGLSSRAADMLALERFNPLIGTYCDATVEMGENRYLFSSDVTRVEPAWPGRQGVRIYVTRPETLQVAQRRRFRRIQLPQASQIEIRWRGEDDATGKGVGWLYNIGQDGIACRTDTLLADRLFIGQEVMIDFSLRPGEQEHFVLDAVICNKTPAGTADRTILGMQFLVGQGHNATATVREALRRRLRVISTSPAGIRKGVDA
jgi:hypothetical protein